MLASKGERCGEREREREKREERGLFVLGQGWRREGKKRPVLEEGSMVGGAPVLEKI